MTIRTALDAAARSAAARASSTSCESAARSRGAVGTGSASRDQQQLDAARTRLVQDGDEYLAEAWAFVDASRGLIAQHNRTIVRVAAHPAHAAAVRLAKLDA